MNFKNFHLYVTETYIILYEMISTYEFHDGLLTFINFFACYSQTSFLDKL